MRFLADESCDFAIVECLVASGHDVIAVRDTAQGAQDTEVSNLANDERRILLTEDKDFGRIVFSELRSSSGIILIRFPGNRRRDVGAAVLNVIDHLAENLYGRFVVIQPGRVRISKRLEG